jgi:hypothetical protein
MTNLLPTKPTDAQRDEYVRNIKATWYRATPDQLTRGATWYPNVHSLAEFLSGGNASQGAGVISALSPMKLWTENVKLATDALNGNVHGHFGSALHKVALIMSGSDPANVLPMNLKTGNFYRNILDPSDPDPVTIDRHAIDIAAGRAYVGMGAKGHAKGSARQDGLTNVNRYASLAHAYRVAAVQLGVLPNVLQATTWLVQTEN